MEVHQISNFTYTDSHTNPSTLESKIRYLEEKMVQLQFELAAEKQYLDSERAQAFLSTEGNAQPTGHFPQCPMASSSVPAVDPLCPLHGSSSRMSSAQSLYPSSVSQMSCYQNGTLTQPHELHSNQYYNEEQIELGQQRAPDQSGQQHQAIPQKNYFMPHNLHPPAEGNAYETPASRMIYQQDVPFQIFEKEVYNTDNLDEFSSKSSFFDDMKGLNIDSSLDFGDGQGDEAGIDAEEAVDLDGEDYLEKLLELDELCKQEMKRVNDAAGCLRPLNQLASDWEVEKLESVLASEYSTVSTTKEPIKYKDVFEDIHPELSSEGDLLHNTEELTTYHSGSENDEVNFSNGEEE